MKNSKSRISRATVYKTLELLAQCELLSKRNFGDNTNRFESSFKKQVHDHLICVDCGKIIEFADTRIKRLPEEISEDLKMKTSDYLCENQNYFLNSEFVEDENEKEREHFLLEIKLGDDVFISRIFPAYFFHPKVRYTVDIRPN